MHEGSDPYENLALEELLFQNLQEDMILLYLWQNENTVVIGRNQNAWRECRLDRLEADGGRLARRLSGGGAVYHDLGNQNFSFLLPAGQEDVTKQSLVICRAVRAFGVDARLSGRNDILAGGGKFSGNAYHRTKGRALHHGTILIDTDFSALSRYLAPSPEKLRSKGVESVRARVINLRELAPAITAPGMREVLIESFAAAYGSKPQPLPLQAFVTAEALQARRAHYESAAFRLGRRTSLADFDWQMHRYFTFGEFELFLSVKEGAVQAAKAYSDVMDADWVQALEAALLGVPFQRDALVAAVPESGMTQAAPEELRQYFLRDFE